MTDFSALIRPDLRAFASYTSARSSAGYEAVIAIDANESPWPPVGRLAAEYQFNRYPEPQSGALVQRLASLYGIAPDTLLISRGSDESIDLLIRLLCVAGTDSILICPPTFGMYEVYARLQGALVHSVPLKACGPEAGWQLDLPAIEAIANPTTKLIFIPSPNAPMGHLMNTDDLLALCRARQGQGLVVVDEAYIEFTDNLAGLVAHLPDTPNLVILRTLSKAHALAGERVGCAIADPALIAALRRIMAPYPLPQSSIQAALSALGPSGLVEGRRRVEIVKAERVRMSKMLLRSPFIAKIYPSVSNFLLVEATDRPTLLARLKEYGIRARDRQSDMPGCVRLSIGAPAENDIVLQALGVVVEKPSRRPRLFTVERRTKETRIEVTVDLDLPSFLQLQSGIGFFDHMLAQIATHGGFGLSLICTGDLEIDQHHSIEDCALALGEAIKGALGDKGGIGRFGFTAPLDEAVASVVIDLSGRPFASFTGQLPTETIGEMTAEMVPHFFQSLAMAMGAAIHVTVTGENAHHMVESSFKALGRALRQALRYEGENAVPSSKGVL